MVKQGYEKYDYGIYRGQHQDYNVRDKSKNLSTHSRLMLNKSLNMFEYHNLPDTVPERELERILQTSGYAGWVEVEGELYVVWGGLGGEQDEYYRPTLMTVANPGLKTKTGTYSETLEIGEDVVLMRNDDNMVGLMPIYGKYGTLMSEADLTIYIMLINKRSENIISASDDNTAESARQYLKKLEEGEIGYIQESKLYDSLKTNPTHSGSTGSSFTELTELIQYLKGSMYNEIGLNANFNMKRERLNTSEIEMNTEALYPMVDNMLYNRRLALEQVNEKFGTDIQVEFNSSWDYRLGNRKDTGETPLDYIVDEDGNAPVDPYSELSDEELDLALEDELNALDGHFDDIEVDEIDLSDDDIEVDEIDLSDDDIEVDEIDLSDDDIEGVDHEEGRRGTEQDNAIDEARRHPDPAIRVDEGLEDVPENDGERGTGTEETGTEESEQEEHIPTEQEEIDTQEEVLEQEEIDTQEEVLEQEIVIEVGEQVEEVEEDVPVEQDDDVDEEVHIEVDTTLEQEEEIEESEQDDETGVSVSVGVDGGTDSDTGNTEYSSDDGNELERDTHESRKDESEDSIEKDPLEVEAPEEVLDEVTEPAESESVDNVPEHEQDTIEQENEQDSIEQENEQDSNEADDVQKPMNIVRIFQKLNPFQ